MGSEGQLDPSHFTLYLLEALKDPQVKSALNKSIDHMKINDNVSIEVGKHIKILQEKIKKQDQEISDLKEKNLDLENRLTDLEQYSRKNTLKIEGIEETNDENTFDTVLNICEKLNVDPPIELKDIDNCHRVGRSPTNGRPRAIIVKFSSYRARKRVYDTRLDLADHNKRLRERAAEGGSDDVFHEAGTEPTVARDSTEPPPEQHAGRRPGSRVTTRNSPAPEPSTDADPDSIPEDDTNQHDVPELISRFPVYINEALCKSRSKLSFAARQLKHKKRSMTPGLMMAA